MYNKKQIIEALDNFINKTTSKLSTEELNSLSNIKKQLLRAKKETEILRWSIEILKLFEIIKDIFK